MNSLEKYIEKHGYHFTVELATEVIDNRWKPSIILSSSEEHVYYNVTEATPGDIIALVNMNYKITHCSKKKCIRKALDIVGDVDKEGYAFIKWLQKNKGHDFSKYI